MSLDYLFLLKLGFLQFIQVNLSAGVGSTGIVGDGQDVICPVLVVEKKIVTVTYSWSGAKNEGGKAV